MWPSHVISLFVQNFLIYVFVIYLIKRFFQQSLHIKKGAESHDDTNHSESSGERYYKLVMCILCLHSVYLTSDEQEMRLVTWTSNRVIFTDSQFIVLTNSLLASLVAGVCSLVVHRHCQKPPFYVYSYSSISTTLGSWCHYEALKLIGYHACAVAMTIGVLPLMLMRKFVSYGTPYSLWDYFTTIISCLGIIAATLAGENPVNRYPDVEATVVGVVILMCYILCTSFALNWQSNLFETYRSSFVHMMFGINLVSCLMAALSLLIRGTFFSSVYLFKDLEFTCHFALLSLCSTVGQLFSFYTISTFGPVVFIMIIVTRLPVATVLSCLLSKCAINRAAAGVLIMGVALILKTVDFFKTTTHIN